MLRIKMYLILFAAAISVALTVGANTVGASASTLAAKRVTVMLTPV